MATTAAFPHFRNASTLHPCQQGWPTFNYFSKMMVGTTIVILPSSMVTTLLLLPLLHTVLVHTVAVVVALYLSRPKAFMSRIGLGSKLCLTNNVAGVTTVGTPLTLLQEMSRRWHCRSIAQFKKGKKSWHSSSQCHSNNSQCWHSSLCPSSQWHSSPRFGRPCLSSRWHSSP